MKVHLLYNRNSGSDSHSEHQLIAALEQAGHTVRLLSLEEDLEPGECEVLAVAGGDGTIGKTIRHFYEVLTQADIPLALIPVGTANNIATSFGVGGDLKQRAIAWNDRTRKGSNSLPGFNIGLVEMGAMPRLFLESIGCGLLTQLIRIGDEEKSSGENVRASPQDELRIRQQNLLSLLSAAASCHYEISIDGRDYSDDYLMVEVMNINRVGPGLEFSPGSDQSDDLFEVIMISNQNRADLAAFVTASLQGGRFTAGFETVPGREIHIHCPASYVHIDDHRPEGKGQETLVIKAMPKPLRILD